MKKYTEKEIEEMRNWLLNKLFNQRSIWETVRKNMIKNGLDPFGKDIDLFFKKIRKMAENISENPDLLAIYQEGYRKVL